ncbi:MAG: amino acid ABC transporter substrate-binding protein [Desulfobacteraceae bacterium]|nr:MAG: amino acid ABC transporter substrate-binding protein [Desulfobacteraceae bacterium]
MKYCLQVSLFLLLIAPFSSAIGSSTPDDEIVFGVATSLGLLEGEESLRAVQVAVEEINEQGGVSIGGRKRKVRVEAADLRDALPGVSVADALESLERLIVEKRVTAVLVGPFRSEVLLPAMDIVAKHRVVLLGTIAMSPASDIKVMRNKEYRYVFRLCLNSRYLVSYLIDSMKLLKQAFGFSKVFIMHQDVAWARTTVSLMIKLYFEKAGWTVLGVEDYSGGSTDYSSGLRKAYEQGAQVVLPIFDMPEAGSLVNQWKEMKVPALVCGFMSSMMGPGAWESSRGKVAGAVSVSFELGNVPAPKYPPSLAFYKAYEAFHGKQIEAGHGPAPAYESVFVLAEAIERAGSLDPEEVVSALEKTDRQGVMGRIRFQRGHQVVFGKNPEQEALACVFQWAENGRRKIVYPPSIAEGAISLPSNLSPHFLSGK